VVADEAGLGGVPPGAGSRRFLDLSGEATQVLAAKANAVWLVVAGQPMQLRAPAQEGQESLPAPEATELREHGDTQVPPGHLDFAVSVVPGGPSHRARGGRASGPRAFGRN